MKNFKQILNKIKNFFKSIKYSFLLASLFEMAIMILLLTNTLLIMYKSTIYFDLAKYSIATFWLLVIGYMASKK
jgi:hypothetical protein